MATTWNESGGAGTTKHRSMDDSLYRLHAELELTHWWFVARRRILSELIQTCVAPDPNAIIVDVGCGTGGNIAFLDRKYRGVGIDTSQEAIRLARERNPAVEFVCGNAPLDLDGLAKQARLFLLSDVLEHVQDDRALLSALVAEASVGTYFLLTVPADMSLWSEHDESYGHYRRYELPGFRDLWKSLPVSTQFAGYCNSRLYPLVKLSRTFSNWRRPSGAAIRTDLRQPNRYLNRLLEWYFSGERRRLLNAFRGKTQGYRRGVSLIAVLRREPPPQTTSTE